MGVPSLPGVPPLPASSIEPFNPVVLSQAPINIPSERNPVWGVFDIAGRPVAVSDSFIGMGYRSESRISDFQIEDGAFASYNKVEIPYQGYVRLACGGSAETRQAFLNALDAAKKSLGLYVIITPDAVYRNANITGYDYRHELRGGVGVLLVDLRLEEVRIVKATYTNTARQPSGASPANGGKTQPVPPTTSQRTSIGATGTFGTGATGFW